jgi:nicotinamidase-related amidase
VTESKAKPGLGGRSQAFLDWLEVWLENLSPFPLDEAIAEAGGADRLAIYSVDVLEGFCRKGPLASERVGRIVRPIRELFRRAHSAGVRRFILTQDAHPADSPEFDAWGPHCVAGSEEAQMVRELGELPFADSFRIIPKTSISTHIGTALMDEPLPGAAIAVGDVTDICTYQLAIGLKAQANAAGISMPVTVPENCTQTWDLPLETAPPEGKGPMPHPGDLLHGVFLYHMMLNGVRVVSAIT